MATSKLVEIVTDQGMRAIHRPGHRNGGYPENGSNFLCVARGEPQGVIARLRGEAKQEAPHA